MLIRCQFVRQNTRIFKQAVIICALTDRNEQVPVLTAIRLLNPFNMKCVFKSYVTFRAVRVFIDGNYGRSKLCSSIW